MDWKYIDGWKRQVMHDFRWWKYDSLSLTHFLSPTDSLKYHPSHYRMYFLEGTNHFNLYPFPFLPSLGILQTISWTTDLRNGLHPFLTQVVTVSHLKQ